MHVQGQQDQHQETDRSYCVAEAWNQCEWMSYLDMSILHYYCIQLMHFIHRIAWYEISKSCYTWLYSYIPFIIEFMLDLWGQSTEHVYDHMTTVLDMFKGIAPALRIPVDDVKGSRTSPKDMVDDVILCQWIMRTWLCMNVS